MKYLLLPILLFCTQHLSAQSKQGTITYEEVINLDIKLDGEMEAFAAMMPKEKKNKKVLYYTPQATLYKTIKNQPRESHMNSNGMNVVFEMNEPEEITYKDLASGKQYEKREFMGRKFLITEELKQADWKMTGKQKEMLGYPCQEAITMGEEDTIIAWFTPAIPVSSGPGSLGMLPGMILEVHVNKDLHIVALSVEDGIKDGVAFEKPKGGKKVTSEEYEAIVKEKTKEMQEQYGGKGNRVIMMKVTEDR